MKTVAPDYYLKFHCIAGMCKRSCCIGWEIDIDDDTFEKYNNLTGKLSEKLKNSIDSENRRFITDENDRCPFLNEENLCEIIINEGEDALCNICTDHPRFRNFYECRTEIGLGLVCEEAARIIINNPDKVKLITIDDDGEYEEIGDDEKYAIEIRDRAIEILQNGIKTPIERINDLLDFTESCLPNITPKRWSEILRTLERLDSKWDEYLDLLEKAEEFSLIDSMKFQQIAVYFAYRHISKWYDDDLLEAHAAFIALSTLIICTIFEMTGAEDNEILLDIASLYSGEIEYSEENLDEIYKWLI